MGWRKTLVEAVETAVNGLGIFATVQIWNKDLEEGLSKGKLPIAPFCIVHYSGYVSETLGEKPKRRIRFGITIGVKGLRGEQSAFKGGDDTPVADLTAEAALETFETEFWGKVLVADTSPAIIGDEEYLGTINGVECWGTEIFVTAIFDHDDEEM